MEGCGIQRQMSKEPGRNAPCPCGSGKKWKKCCRGLPLPARAWESEEARLRERFHHLVAAIQGEALEQFGVERLSRWTASLQADDPGAELGIFAEFTAFHAGDEDGQVLACWWANRNLLSTESRAFLEAVLEEPYSIYQLLPGSGEGETELLDLLTGARRRLSDDGQLDGASSNQAWLYAKVLTYRKQTVLLSCWPALLDREPAEAVARRHLKGRQQADVSTLGRPEEARALFLSWSVLARAVARLDRTVTES